MTNLIEKRAEYVSCMFVHHSAVFCQLFSVHNHWKSWSQTIP